MKKAMILLLAIWVLSFAEKLLPQSGKPIYVDKVTIPVVAIEDKDLMDFFIYEFFIAETLVTKIEIIDATGNGFGEDDLVKTYPSEQIYFPVPSDSAQKIMNSWEFKANFQIVSENREPEEFEQLPTEKAENGIFASLLRGVNRNYQDAPISIWFNRGDNGITFEMWGFNKDNLNFNPPPPSMPDSVTTYDLLRITRSDTLMRTDTTSYDLIYVYKTQSDTVVVGQDFEDRKRRRRARH